MNRDNSFRFSLRYLLLAVITAGAVFGWYSSRIECRKLQTILESERTQKSDLLAAATIEAKPILNFQNIVGKPIENFPLFQVLGTKGSLKGSQVKNWRQNSNNFIPENLPDRFGNRREGYRQLDIKKEITVYHITLDGLDQSGEGDRYHTITIFVHDGVIRLVLENENVVSS